MNRLFSVIFIALAVFIQADLARFARDHQALDKYYDREVVILIASSGRSGSTLLCSAVRACAPGCTVVKTHLLPPSRPFKGKVLFIFSNPDLAAESALHRSMGDRVFGFEHFQHVETADFSWLQEIGDSTQQTLIHNLLCYDALGYTEQLRQWLHTKQPTGPKYAQILAIKYEHLWDKATIDAIRRFLDLKIFRLPPQQLRGCSLEEMSELEASIRLHYNLGSLENPRYAAYDEARELWKNALPFQYFRLRPK